MEGKTTETPCCTKHTETPATAYCKTCKIFMCADECMDAHAELFSDNHDVSVLEDEESTNKCPVHKNQSLNFFCYDCCSKKKININSNTMLFFNF